MKGLQFSLIAVSALALAACNSKADDGAAPAAASTAATAAADNAAPAAASGATATLTEIPQAFRGDWYQATDGIPACAPDLTPTVTVEARQFTYALDGNHVIKVEPTADSNVIHVTFRHVEGGDGGGPDKVVTEVWELDHGEDHMTNSTDKGESINGFYDLYRCTPAGR